ncbi:hypothetical protein Tco_0507647 [Tanacetum coccineum]
MAESSSQNPSSPNLTPKEERVTLDKPESPNPFLPAIQVEFAFEEVAFTTNNEVALIYPSHPNQEYFKDVLPDSKIWVSTPTGEVRGEIGYNGEIRAKRTFKKSYLPPRWRYHFIRYHILKGDIELHFIPTQYQLADIFTKPLDEPTFKRLIVELGMLNIDSKPEASALTEEN